MLAVLLIVTFSLGFFVGAVVVYRDAARELRELKELLAARIQEMASTR